MAGGTQRMYKQRIHATSALQKVFNAQELIAASRISAARARMLAAMPFADAVNRAVAAVALHGHIDHALTTPRSDTSRVAVLVVSADRGMAGSFSASIIRQADVVMDQLVAQGRQPVLYAAGSRAVSHYQYHDRQLAGSWVYGSDVPQAEHGEKIADALLAAFTNPDPQLGVSAIHVVYTQYLSMVTQAPRVVTILPLAVEQDTEVGASAGQAGESRSPGPRLDPVYDFEPSAAEVLDVLLPQYVRSRLYSYLADSAVAELASRQKAMHSATQNANDLISKFTRLANEARQNEITNEITEIVSGADALAQDK